MRNALIVSLKNRRLTKLRSHLLPRSLSLIGIDEFSIGISIIFSNSTITTIVDYKGDSKVLATQILFSYQLFILRKSLFIWTQAGKIDFLKQNHGQKFGMFRRLYVNMINVTPLCLMVFKKHNIFLFSQMM